MRNINVAAKLLIVLGALITAVALFAFLWPLGIVFAALFLASSFSSLLKGSRGKSAKNITPVMTGFRSERQLADDQLFDVPESTAAR